MSAKPHDPRLSWGHDEWWTWLDAECRKGNLHALASVDRALEAFPDSGQFHSMRGKVLIPLGRIDEARQALERALELRPGDGLARLRLAQASVWQGRFQEAAKWIEGASRSVSQGERIRPHIATLRIAMGDFAGAMRVLPLAIARAPNDSLLELHEQALNGLCRDAEAGVAPRFKAAYTLALEHLRTGEAAAAEAVLRKLVRYCPTYAPGWMALRGALEAQGRNGEAQTLGSDWAKATPRAGAEVAIGMSRKLGRRGLVFDPSEPFAIAPMAEALTKVSTPAELQTAKDAVLIMDPGGKSVRHEPVLSVDGHGDDRLVIEYVTGRKFIAAVNNAALVGRGVVVSADGRIVRELLPSCRGVKFGARVRDERVTFESFRFLDGLCPVRLHGGPAFLMAGPTDESFGDWMLNFAPRLAMMEAAGLDCPILVTQPLPQQRLDILAALGVGKERLIFHDSHGVALFPKLYVPSWPSHEKAAPSQGVLDIYQRAALKSGSGSPRLLYLTRKNVNSRRLINEDAVCDLFRRRGFEIIDPGTQSFAETRAQFANAACVAGPFGSAFLNIAFCADKPTNLVLFPGYTGFSLTELALWHGEVGQKFAYVVGDALPDDRIGRHKRHAPWIAPLDKIDRALDLILERAEHEPA
jgi:capsular polysaccharide biosynthesis protein/Flp pilus assembly protein TadD